MDEFEGGAWGEPPERRRPRQSWRTWLLAGGLTAAFLLALGVGAALGSGALSTVQAAAVNEAFNASPLNARVPFASTPGAGRTGQGPCQSYTVSSVSGQTIVAKDASGNSVTIHVTSSTRFTKAGQSAAASAVTAGARISVMGTTNSDGSITATSIDVR